MTNSEQLSMFSMFSITADQVTSGVLSLFDLSKPTMPRAFNVLEGVNRGQILVDDPSYPTSAVIRDAIYGTLYFGGQINMSLFEALVQNFCRLGDVGFGCWLDDPINQMIPSTPDYDGRTLCFTQRLHVKNDEQRSLPDGYSVALRDRELFKQSFDYQSTLAAFTNEENVLEHTLGIMILYEGRVVCEAATGAPTHGQIEVGITTEESHRQRGLAFIACTRLIKLCEAKGYRTWWDCAKQNIPSVNLARKLGYRNEREYRYVWWRRNKTE
jgi:RimJ/RimL family protein N-acetyltransferase